MHASVRSAYAHTQTPVFIAVSGLLHSSLFCSHFSYIFSLASKDGQVSSPSRCYLLSHISSQPAYACLEDGLYPSEPTGLLLFFFMFCRKQLNPELWVPWLAWVPWGSHLPTGSQPSLGACFSHADRWICLTLILGKKEVQTLHVSRRNLISPTPKRRHNREVSYLVPSMSSCFGSGCFQEK